MDSEKYHGGLERHVLESYDAMEIRLLATIAHFHVLESEEDLKGSYHMQQSHICKDKKDIKEHDRLTTLFYERRNGFRKAKEGIMSMLHTYKAFKMSELIKKLKKEKEEKEKLDSKDEK